MTRTRLLAAAAVAALTAATPAFAAGPTASEVVTQYGDIALAMYSDALAGAKTLDAAVGALIATPSEATLAAARKAWIDARPAYQQTEGFRFGNAIVDDWEGRVNAWPLDEGLIDYVDTASYGDASDENPLYAANVIASKTLQIGPDTVDASTIDVALIRDRLQEAQDVESNVAIGYHAIEFLLWGQDLNGTGPGAGNRPYTDYDTANCTNGNCDRRGAYLKAATDLLVADLEEMVGNWQKDGAARAQLAEKGEDGGIATILTGLGSLSYGELGGERMKLGLLLHDPEEEHDCFSDNTHNSHYYDIVGMSEIWHGKYTRADGTVLEGPSIAAYAAAKDEAAAKRVDAAIAATLAKAQVMKDRADSGVEAYDQMIGPDNPEGNKVVEDVIDGLVGQTRAIEAVVASLGVEITVEGSDSLDNPAAVGAP
ncbi:imelysin family protein [Prosthecomicrobium pneumaticum]|uniref:Putative iron-regulated protein n=1 Tax=Prosthecomicrobium pneumaticum TaxID=81895 RepID=A0A7W9L1J2_9HYPH|nr:imelysin family protein [Prosthecomicrobium pneumaticum]MBB5752797.1 putative iron-regulated protein [Prosthecomicrobium pneumaticum]